MSQLFVITCEHAGNSIPFENAYLFSGKEEKLYTHEAIDLGALRLAKKFASVTKLPLHYTTISRLLVEANRSPNDEELFSECVKNEPEHVKQDILEKYYWPHRKKVEDIVGQLIAEGNQVIHLAIHTFAPVLEGEVRDTDIGILFDPGRTQEQLLAEAFREEILKLNPCRSVHHNSPYPGILDCFPNYLRKRFSPELYLGFEFEINQKFFLTGEAEVWEALELELTKALLAVKERLSNASFC